MMPGYVVHDGTNVWSYSARDPGTELPEGMQVEEISDADFDRIRDGLAQWTPSGIVDTGRAQTEANVEAIRQGLIDAMDPLNTITNYDPGSKTTAQRLADHEQALKSLARNQRRLIRLFLDILDGTD